MSVDLTSVGRTDLEAQVESLVAINQDLTHKLAQATRMIAQLAGENTALSDNTTAVQARCSELLAENRRLRDQGMPLQEYQRLALRTSNHENQTLKERVGMACMGLAGESGEVIDYLKKVYFHDHDLSLTQVRNELGDVLWYVTELCSCFDLNLGVVADKNIEKLKARYPEGFDEQKSKDRTEYNQADEMNKLVDLMEKHFGHSEEVTP